MYSVHTPYISCLPPASIPLNSSFHSENLKHSPRGVIKPPSIPLHGELPVLLLAFPCIAQCTSPSTYNIVHIGTYLTIGLDRVHYPSPVCVNIGLAPLRCAGHQIQTVSQVFLERA